MIKKCFFLILIFLISNNLMYSQKSKLIKDFSYENDFGSKDEFISMYFMLDKNSLAKKEVELHNGKNAFPFLVIPFDLVPEIKNFLTSGRVKFHEWDAIRKSNNVLEMQKEISVFNKKIKMYGDDYGVFSGDTQITLNYISWSSGKSVMQLKAYISNGVRSETIAFYLCYGDVEAKTNKNFDLFLNDFTLDFLNSELIKNNEQAKLFGN